MDNITHSLVGVAVAEVALSLRERRTEVSPRLNLATWLTAIIASNAPDLDVVASVMGPAPTTYLLTHRAHTHSFFLGPLVALLSMAAPTLWLKRHEKPPMTFLGAVGLVGVLLHIAFDFANHLGVHPLWPFNDRWFFGDSLFIIEPTIWAFGAASLMFAAKRRVARVAFGAVPVLAIVASIVTGFVPPLVVGLLGTFTPLFAWLSHRLARGQRAALATSVLVAVPLVFFVFGTRARTVAQASLQRLGEESIEDIALSLMPGNPFCWSATSVQRSEGTLIERRFGVSTNGALVPVASCHIPYGADHLAPSRAIQASFTDDVIYFDEVRLEIDHLRSLAAERCDVNDYLRFSRAPFVSHDPSGPLLGDLRYDTPEGHRFSRVTMQSPPACVPFPSSLHGPLFDLLSIE